MGETQIERLIARARGFGPLVICELQWGSFDEDGPPWRHQLDLCAIVAEAGPKDSRYRTGIVTSVPGDSPEEQAAAAVTLQAIAAGLGLEASMLALEQRHVHVGGSRWIDAQGSAPAATYRCRWEGIWWNDAGRRETGNGWEEVAAASGERAVYEARERVRARLGGLRRPIELRAGLEGWPLEHWHMHQVARPPMVPPIGDVRGWWRDGMRIVAIAHRLCESTPAPAPLDLMIAIADAFQIPVARLGAVADWAAGTIDDDALAAALDASIDASTPRWDLVRRLRQGWIDGSLGAAVRAELAAGTNRVMLHCDLYMALGIDLGASQLLCYHAWDGDDAAVDELVLWIRGGNSIRTWFAHRARD